MAHNAFCSTYCSPDTPACPRRIASNSFLHLVLAMAPFPPTRFFEPLILPLSHHRSDPPCLTLYSAPDTPAPLLPLPARTGVSYERLKTSRAFARYARETALLRAVPVQSIPSKAGASNSRLTPPPSHPPNPRPTDPPTHAHMGVKQRRRRCFGRCHCRRFRAKQERYCPALHARPPLPPRLTLLSQSHIEPCHIRASCPTPAFGSTIRRLRSPRRSRRRLPLSPLVPVPPSRPA